MPIRVAIYIAEGVATGVLAASGHLRDVLEAGEPLVVDRATWRPWGASADQPAGELRLAPDDILIAVGDDDPTIPVHAAWHQIRLEAGPYVVEGELPTLPGYDPGRALARPTGEFVLLRDVRLGAVESGGATMVQAGSHAHVNRYGVDRVSADLMLGFFFPGAALDAIEPEELPALPALPSATPASATPTTTD
jgi:hypothetical protein